MGLAPQITEEIFEIIAHLNKNDGVSFLLAEENANAALRYATYGYVLEGRRVVAEGTSSQLDALGVLQDAFLVRNVAQQLGVRSFKFLPRARTLGRDDLRTR